MNNRVAKRQRDIRTVALAGAFSALGALMTVPVHAEDGDGGADAVPMNATFVDVANGNLDVSGDNVDIPGDGSANTEGPDRSLLLRVVDPVIPAGLAGKNSVTLSQYGDRNSANLWQSGHGNELSVGQTGDYNSASVTQTGYGNQLHLTQVGYGLNIGIRQRGEGAQVSVRQTN